MTYLTVFSAPKPFTNHHINTIQRNAIQSWKHCGPDVEVILVGDEDGMDVVAQDYGLVHLQKVAKNSWGTPLVSSIFELVLNASSSPFLAYVNADILLMPDFVEVTRQIASQQKKFLVVGQRWDLDVVDPIDFSPNWDSHLRELTIHNGSLHRPSGSDYFIYPRFLFKDIPDFAIGRAGWDNWMIYQALNNKWHVIDATSSLMIVHQNHDYSHLPGGKPHYDLEETKINAALGGGYRNMYITLDTNYELIDGIVRRARWGKDRFLRRLERFFRPPDDKNKGFRWRIARKFRRMRRGL